MVEAGRQGKKEGQTQQLRHARHQGIWASFCNTEAVVEEPRGFSWQTEQTRSPACRSRFVTCDPESTLHGPPRL